MSCCGGNCGCGSACKCGNGCGGCKMYPDLSYSEAAGAANVRLVLGVAPQKTYFEESETVMGAAENGCKCGGNCTCDPCNCK
ncbi:metallothionein-like protein type 2 [Sesamum indicum]|uniref:Metallothionein-like protein n=1 Tax=Sesamum indicum TaxID=4182 RepID=A0A6I9UAR0_SESIN|nr:metallothionein-like protein type 2 [Sesamum indicum]